MDFLNKNDAYIVYANDEVDTTNANGKLLTRLLISVSQKEIEGTSERTKFGMAGAIKAGHIPGVTPLGYDRVDKKLVINSIDNDLFETVRYSNYMDKEHVTNHLNKLRKYYDVSMHYGKFNQNTNILNFAFNPTHKVIRIFPIENDFSKEEVNMGILSIHETKVYTREKLEQEIYDEFMTDELLLNNPELH